MTSEVEILPTQIWTDGNRRLEVLLITPSGQVKVQDLDSRMVIRLKRKRFGDVLKLEEKR